MYNKYRCEPKFYKTFLSTKLSVQNLVPWNYFCTYFTIYYCNTIWHSIWSSRSAEYFPPPVRMYSMVPFLLPKPATTALEDGWWQDCLIHIPRFPFGRGDRHKNNFLCIIDITHSSAHACVATSMHANTGYLNFLLFCFHYPTRDP